MNRLLRAVLIISTSVQASVAAAAMTVQSFAPEKHERFYNLPDPAKAFIGDPHDWSGVGRSSRWATMISPSYFLSADHHHPPLGSLYFYLSNDPTGPVETRTIASGQQIAGTDLWLGQLASPVSSDVAKYPVLLLPDHSDYDDLEIFTFGQSDSAVPETNVRLGRNNIDPDSFDSYGESPGSIGIVYTYDFDNPGGLGDDESYLQTGDSGGPSFAIYQGAPALVGIHWFIDDEPDVDFSGDTFVPDYIGQINAAMVGEQLTVVPAPGTAVLLALAAAAWLIFSRKRGLH